MTATDELHRLLTEAGVEYQFNDATKIFEWHYDGTYGEGFAHATEAHGGINIIACSLTPEQVIAATLGPRSDSCNCTNGERTNLAVTLGDTDATHERQGDAETCKAEETATIKCWIPDGNGSEHRETIHIMECSVCGGTYEHVNGSYEFCPRCGRRVEVDE